MAEPSMAEKPSSLDVLASAVICEKNGFSSEFPEAVIVQPHEIHKNHCPIPNSAREMEGFSTPTNKEFNHSQLLKSLKKMAATQTAAFKAMPEVEIPENLPSQPLQLVAAPEMQVGSQARAQTRVKTKLTGDISVTFELPEDFPKDTGDLETLVPDGSPTPQTPRRFSLSERLQGWRITRRKRVNGISDLYYSHERSNTKLRSVVELARFILYEEHPSQRLTNFRIVIRDVSAEKGTETRSAPVTRKFSDTTFGYCEEPMEEPLLKSWLDAVTGNLRFYRFVKKVKVSEEKKVVPEVKKKVATERKPKNVTFAMEKGECSKAVPAPPPEAVSMNPSMEGEASIDPPTGVADQAVPVSHVEVGHPSPMDIGGDLTTHPIPTPEEKKLSVASPMDVVGDLTTDSIPTPEEKEVCVASPMNIVGELTTDSIPTPEEKKVCVALFDGSKDQKINDDGTDSIPTPPEEKKVFVAFFDDFNDQKIDDGSDYSLSDLLELDDDEFSD